MDNVKNGQKTEPEVMKYEVLIEVVSEIAFDAYMQDQRDNLDYRLLSMIYSKPMAKIQEDVKVARQKFIDENFEKFED